MRSGKARPMLPMGEKVSNSQVMAGGGCSAPAESEQRSHQRPACSTLEDISVARLGI